MRQFAGFGTAEETNGRFRYLLDHGQTGLSTAFDMPSLMGHDSDHPRSLGEVGPRGSRSTHSRTWRRCSRDPARTGSVSMTINAPAAIMLAFYVVAAERRGIGRRAARGDDPDRHPQGVHRQKEWCFPVDPAMRLVMDMIEWCAEHMPRWHPISISGYRLREAGSTAAQELAFTLKDGLTYVEQAVARGLDVDDFAPRLSFFFNAHIDFFEEIAKYRAARRIWARELRDTFGARDGAGSLLMRFHTQTAGVSLTGSAAAQQHRAHGDRGAGGRARRVPVRSHQQLRRGARAAHRAGRPGGPANPADHRRGDGHGQPDRPPRRVVLSRGADHQDGGAGVRVLAKIDELGGWWTPSSRGSPEREIADAAFQYQQEVESGGRRVVGVNAYTEGEDGAARP